MLHFILFKVYKMIRQQLMCETDAAIKASSGVTDTEGKKCPK